MTTTPLVMTEGTLLTTALVELYDADTPVTGKIYSIILCNTSVTQSVGVTVHFIEPGGVAELKNRVFGPTNKGLILAPGESRVIGLESRIAPGGSVEASATVTDVVSFRMSGDEVT